MMRPGNSPVRNLADVLNQPDVFGSAADDSSAPEADIYVDLTEAALRRGSPGLVEVVKQARMNSRESLLLIVDQFEELFRFQRVTATLAAKDEATAFVKLLLAAVQQREVPIYVVLTMRSDFLGDCAQFQGLPEVINDSQYLIPRMTRAQRRSAIEGPVAVGGATIAPRLVNRLLNDMGDNPDQLPILQHALMRTWERWVQDHTAEEPLDLRHYEAVGGMAGALSQHPDEVYRALDERSQMIAEKLFRCLTEKGADNRAIRRPAPLLAVCAVAAATQEEVIQVVEPFRAPDCSFLMPPAGVELTDTSVLDISHESLMRVWQRLKGWVDAEVQSAQIYHRLAETAALHAAGEAGYLQDPELTIALTWQKEVKPNQAWAERYAPNFEQSIVFLEESAAVQKSARRKKYTLLALVFSGLIGLSVFALGQRENALNALAEAESQTVAARKAEERAEAAAEEAEAAARTAKESESFALQQTKYAQEQEDMAIAEKEKADQQRVIAQAQTREAESQKEIARSEKENADRQRLIAEDQTREAESQREVARREKDEADRQRLIAEDRTREAVTAQTRAVEQTQIAEDEKFKAELLATSSQIEMAFSSGQQLMALLGGIAQGYDTLNSDAFGKANQRSVVDQLSFNTTLRKIVDDIQQTNQWPGHASTPTKLLFNPNPDSEFAITSLDEHGTLSLWDRNGRPLNTISINTEAIFSAVDSDFAFNPQGTAISYTNRQGEVVTIRLAKALLLREERLSSDASSTDKVTGGFSDSYSFEGQANQKISIHLESRDFDTFLRLFNADGEEVAKNDDYNNYNSFLEYTLPEAGQYQVLVTSFGAGSTGTYKLSVSPALDKVVLPAHSSPVIGLGFAPDGTLITAGEDGYIKLWSNVLDPTSTPTWEANLGFIEEAQDGFLEADRNNLLSAGLYNEHRYTGQENERIAISLESSPESDLDTFLRLIHSGSHVTDNPIAENDDSGGGLNSLLAIDLSRDDNYRIIATTYQALSQIDTTPAWTEVEEGDYRLSINRILETTSLLSIERALQPEQAQAEQASSEHQHSFRGRAGQLVLLDLKSQAFDTDLELYRVTSDGSRDVIEARQENNNGTGTNSLLLVSLPEDGNYEVEVLSSDSKSGSYRLSVQEVELNPVRSEAFIEGRLESAHSNILPRTAYFYSDHPFTFRAEGEFRVNVESDDFSPVSIFPSDQIVDDGIIRISSREPEGTGSYQLSISKPSKAISLSSSKFAALLGRNTVYICNYAGQCSSSNLSTDYDSPLATLAFSPEGETLLLTDKTGRAYAWNLAENELQGLLGISDSIFDVGWRATGEIATAADDSISILSAEGQRLIDSLPNNSAAQSVTFSPDESTLAATYADGTVKLWSRQQRSPEVLNGLEDIFNIAFAADRQTLITASRKRGEGTGIVSVQSWDTSGRPTAEISHNPSEERFGITAIDLDPSDNTMAIGYGNGLMQLGENHDPVSLPTLPERISFSANGNRVAVAGELGSADSGFITLLQVNELLQSNSSDEATVAIAQPRGSGGIIDISLDPNGDRLAEVTASGQIRLRQVKDDDLVEIASFRSINGSGSSVTFHPASNSERDIVVVGTAKGWIELWQREEGELSLLQAIDSHSRDFKVSRVRFSQDGHILAAASEDGRVMTWNLSLEDTLREGCQWLDSYFKANESTSAEIEARCNQLEQNAAISANASGQSLETARAGPRADLARLWYQFHQWLGSTLAPPLS